MDSLREMIIVVTFLEFVATSRVYVATYELIVATFPD